MADDARAQATPGSAVRAELPPSLQAKRTRNRAKLGEEGKVRAIPQRKRGRRKPSRPRLTVLAQQRLFLANFAKIGNVTSAAQLAKVDRMRHYEWLGDPEKYPEYKAQFREAELQFCDAVERAVVQWGVYGWDRPIYQGGKLVGHEHQHDTQLTVLAAKRFMPHLYRERLDITGANGGPIQTEDLTAVPFAALQARMARALEVLSSNPPPPGPPIDVKALEAGPVGQPIPQPAPESKEARLAAYEAEVRARKGNGHAPGNGKANGHG